MNAAEGNIAKFLRETDFAVQALHIALLVGRTELKEPPRPGDIVWFAIREAMATLNRLPDREAGWLYTFRCTHPEIMHDQADKIEAYETMLERVRIGEEPVAVLVPRAPPPTAQAISRMEAVLTWGALMKPTGRKGNPRRDWKIITQLAAGMKGPKVAAINKVSRQYVWERKEFQCGMLARALVEKYGEVFPSVDKLDEHDEKFSNIR